MRAPGFWGHDGLVAALLSPLETITASATARRVARPSWTAPVPVLCCGNASVGGTGKTPLVLDILARLRARGVNAHALTRGHAGTALGVLRVDPARHAAALVGDEALLLASLAPSWTGADRAASARAALADGAQALILDDGLQNPTLTKTASILVIDGPAGFANGHLLPAGPLRERPATAATRCAAAVIIGPDRTSAARLLPANLPILHARLAPGPAMRALAGQRVLAFAGIGRPTKFFDTLTETGLILAPPHPFPDHHRYTPRDLAALRRDAARAGAMLVTTTKDFVRVPPADRAGILPLPASLAWDNEAAFDALLRRWVP
jgi:tetraacyldisaccharide 4'-kinase